MHTDQDTGTENTIYGKAYLTEKEAARYLNLTTKWFQNKRLTGDGIPYVKLGGAIRYSAKTILDYVKEATRTNSSQ
jgi:Helix-turn-helix domain